MTFSEFGRRVPENTAGAPTTAPPRVCSWPGHRSRGVVGKHPSLADLDADDLKFHTDFRRIYATQLDGWLGCDSKAVLGGNWDHLKELEPKV